MRGGDITAVAAAVTLLIPNISPAYLQIKWCRDSDKTHQSIQIFKAGGIIGSKYTAGFGV